MEKSLFNILKSFSGPLKFPKHYTLNRRLYLATKRNCVYNKNFQRHILVTRSIKSIVRLFRFARFFGLLKKFKDSKCHYILK